MTTDVDQTFVDEQTTGSVHQQSNADTLAYEVGRLGAGLMILYIGLIALLILYGIVQFWPSDVLGSAAAETQNPVNFLFWEFSLPQEIRLIIIVIFSGALGSCVHVIRSLVWYIGNRNFVRSWIPYYLLRPFLGGILALVLYLVLRGGFFSPGASVQDTSPFGFAAMSALVGMFSEQAILKLKELSEIMFTEPKSGADALAQEEEKPAKAS